MLAPAPPRCCTRSSTRKESETFSICPSTNCSVKVPGKVIRWSVAIEPVTHTVTGRSLEVGGGGPTGRPCWAATSLGAAVGRRRPGVAAQHPAQRDAELADGDRAEQRAGRGPGDDDGRRSPEHPGAAEGEPGEGDPRRAFPDRERAGLAHPC